MNFLKLGLISVLAMASSAGWAHSTTPQRVELEPENGAVWAAGAATFKFQLIDTKTKAVLGDGDLDIVHEKKLHFLVYDVSLNEFFHLHPTFQNSLWTVDTNVLRNGKYWLWSQGTISKDKAEFSSSYQVDVINGSAQWPTPPKLQDIRTASSGPSVVTLEKAKIKAGKAAMLGMVFSRTDGATPVINPYLGAIAHIVAVPDDGDSLIHVHPMAGATPTEGMIHVTFPAKGIYRIWVQFIDTGVLTVVPLAIQVQ
jgi:hypothetical protein